MTFDNLLKLACHRRHKTETALVKVKNVKKFVNHVGVLVRNQQKPTVLQQTLQQQNSPLPLQKTLCAAATAASDASDNDDCDG